MQKTQGDLRIEYIPITKLNEWPRNPKKHDTDLISDSMERWGFTQPVMVDETSNRLVAGHGRIETLMRRFQAKESAPERIRVDADTGEWLVPVLRGIGFASEQEAEAYVVADNRTSEVGGWDDKLLNDILSTLNTEGLISGVGFSMRDIDRIVQDSTPDAEATGTTPDEYYETFRDGEIRQVVLYFAADEYDEVLRRLQVAMTHLGADSHTATFLKILEHYEQNVLGIEAAAAPAEDGEEEEADADDNRHAG